MPGSAELPSDRIDAPRTDFVLDARSAADFDVDLQTGLVRCGARLRELLGWTEERAPTRDELYGRVHPDDAQRLRTAVSTAAESESPRFEHEFRVVRPDGQVAWLQARGEVAFDGGRPCGIRGACLDITQSKRDEEAARESDARYRALAQSNPSAIVVACGGRSVYANEAAARLLRAASPRELVGRSLFELLAPDYHDLIRLRIQRVVEQRTALDRVRYRWRRLDGSEVDVDMAAAWVPWSGEDAVQIVAHDITNELLVDEALRESRAQLADKLEDARRLQVVSTRLIQAGDTHGLQLALLREAMLLMRADFGSVQEADLERNELRLIAQHGLDPESARYWSVVPCANAASAADTVPRDGRVIVEDVESCAFLAGTRELDELRRSGIRALQATPLRARDGRLVGAMSTHWSRPHRPPERELQLLDVLARQAADLIELLRAQEQLARNERRTSFLVELNDQLRGLVDARRIQLAAATLLGRHLGASRAGYAEDRGDGAAFVVTQHYTAPGVRSAEGVYRYDAYGPHALEALQAGNTLFGPDAEQQGRLPDAVRSAHRALDLASTINVPLVRDGRLVALLFLHFGEARAWTAEEVALVEEVAARTWDAVERARAETALRESEARLAVVFDTLPVGVGLLDTTGALRLANPEMRRFLPTGVMPSQDDRHGDRWRAYGPDGRVLARRDYPGARALRGEEVVPGIEMCHRGEDGRAVWTRVAAMPTRDSRGRITGAVAAVMDIDAARRAADALRDREECFRHLVEASAQAVWEADADGMQVTGSPSWSAYTGQSFAEMQGSGWADAVHPDDRAAAQRAWHEAVAARRPFEAEFRLRRADGGWRWTSVRAAPLFDDDGSVRKWVGMNVDIDDRRRAEDALRDSLTLLHIATGASQAGWWTWDFATGGAEWDEAGQRIIGFASEEESRSAQGWLDRIHPADVSKVEAEVARCLRDDADLALDYRVVRADGTARLIRAHGRFRKAPDGTPLTGTGLVIDVTDQQAAEHALRDSERRFRTLLENVRDYAIFMLDAHGRVVEWTDGAARVTGYVAEEVLGRHVSIFYTGDAVARGEPQCDLDEAERVGRAEREGWRVCKGGKRIWVNEIATEVRGDDGALRGFIKISRDLTERRRTEQALAEASRHKDDFLAMLSHELRNPLAPIRNSAYLLRHVAGDSAAARNAQSVIERQTQHLARLVDDLLDVTRIARGKIELRRDRVELRELVRRAGDDLRSVLEDRGVRFAVSVPDGKVWCDGDATRLTQAISNLLGNAAKFTRAGDAVELALRVGDDEARISVTDSGIGVDPDLLPQLFTPFVQGDRTLARDEGGLGLGLALVRGIAELHGGRVLATSEGKGRGAEFVITLPLLAGEGARPAPEPRRAASGQRLRVLVVDDNHDAAESLAAIVELLGHAVEVAYDGPTALDKVRAAPPDAVLCDIGLPRMSGYEVAGALRRELGFRGRLIAVTGYAQPDDIRRGAEAGFDGHLAKPFDPERLDGLLG